MIVCPNCSHINPEGALNCEACYTALPATKACPTCGAAVQLDATFCGQCGQSLKPAENQAPPIAPPPAIDPISAPGNAVSTLPPTILATSQAVSIAEPEIESVVPALPQPDLPITVLPTNEVEVTAPPELAPVATVTPGATQIQQSTHHLLHLQTNTVLEIPPHLQVVYLGKPNENSPPDLDVSGFPCSEVVSRVHASIRIEGENYYIEDMGSANGTYINHNSLTKGNRHLLRSGDRISLGKGDLVTFIFQST
jgi:FHA domain/Double zinc ribbon